MLHINAISGAVILQKKGGEILILPEHVTALNAAPSAEAFEEYFLRTALMNRAARKLFVAWARKESDIWGRLRQQVSAAAAPSP